MSESLTATDADLADVSLAPESAGGFRRRLERFRGSSATDESSSPIDDEAEIRLQLMLLREENARLKSARHQPAGAGTVIDRVRILATPATEAETLDDTWSLLGDCLTIREGLDQACVEMQRALDAVRDRLEAIAGQARETVARERVGGQVGGRDPISA